METTVFQQPQPGGQTAKKRLHCRENVKRVEVILLSDEPELTPLPESYGTNGSTETVSALILWITGNSLVCRKGVILDAGSLCSIPTSAFLR